MRYIQMTAAATAAAMTIFTFADVIEVPSAEAPTIQAAIIIAADGDEIVVAPGAYFETIAFQGKALIVRSQDPDDPATVAATVINGFNSGAVVEFTAGEDVDSVLQGLTVTGGAAVRGGGMRIENASPTITDCVVTGNTATDNGAGAYVFNGAPSFDRCTFAENVAEIAGGGITFDQSTPILSTCTFSANESTREGGGVYCRNGSIAQFIDCTFTDNVVFPGSGGALRLRDSTGSLVGGTLESNMAAGHGGGVSGFRSSAYFGGVTIQSNIALTDSGGGVRMRDDEAKERTLTLVDCFVMDNTANISGGGVLANDMIVVISGGAIEANTALAQDGGGVLVSNELSTLSMTATSVQGNIANYSGGGIATFDAASVTLDGVVFDGNVAEVFNGGGVANIRPDVVNIGDCTFVGNRADIGGALWNEGSTGSMSVTTSLFQANTAFGDGGAVALVATPEAKLLGCTFLVNTSGHSGGAARLYDSNTEVTDCTFEGNFAQVRGGGVHLELGAASLAGCTLDQNQAINVGGGLAARSAAAKITGCEFTANSAVVEGGGVRLIFGSGVVVSSKFLGNTAANGGGTATVAGQLTCANVLFAGNHAVAQGGGMYMNDATSSLRNCTLTANSAGTGGALQGFNSPTTVDNGILWNNQASEEGTDEIPPTFDVNVLHSIVEGGYGEPGDDNDDLDPMFLDPDGSDDDPATLSDNDYRLSADAVGAIDQGSNEGVEADGCDLDGDDDLKEPTPFDLAGGPRFIDDPDVPDAGSPAPVVDRGAYEYDPTTGPEGCLADLDRNGAVGASDLALLLGGWGGDASDADLDDDGVVGAGDLAILLGSWGPCE